MIEMLIAIGVLLVAVVGAYSSQLTSMRLVDQSRERAVALADLEACMEQVMVTSPDTLPVTGSPYEHDQPVAAFEALHLAEQRIVASYPGYVAGADVPNPLQVVLTSTWNDSMGRAQSQVLRSMRVR